MRKLSSVPMLIAMCFTQLCATAFAQSLSRPEAYIAKYAPIAQEESRKSGIPASVYLGQAIKESAFGTSDLAVHAFNYFGHKAAADWKGPTYLKFDDERNEKKELVLSSFRKYRSPEESFREHTKFLKKAHYKKLYTYSSSDYYHWALGLKEAGYATSSTYATELIGTINKYKLYEYDANYRAKSTNKVGAVDDEGDDNSEYAPIPNFSKEQPTESAPSLIQEDIIYIGDLTNLDYSILNILNAQGMMPATNSRGNPQFTTPKVTPIPNPPMIEVKKKMVATPDEYELMMPEIPEH